MMIVAIDPGKKGGIAWAHGRDVIVQAMNLPLTPTSIYEALQDIMGEGKGRCFIVLEKTGTYRAGNSGPSSVTFARHCGSLEGLMVGMGLPYTQVSPQRWQKSMGALPKDKALRKRKIKEIMQARYPHLKITLATADALGILTYELMRRRLA